MTAIASAWKELTLAQLLGELAECRASLRGDPQLRVSSITEDSRKVRPGSLFVARQGQRVDGTRFIEAAFQAGACCVLCEPQVSVKGRPVIYVDQLNRAWGLAAQALAAHPSRDLKVIGITGTNGKTTVASLVAEALAHDGQLSARLGTLGFFIGAELIAPSLTTPQPDQLAESLVLARQRGARYALMEVSSHALDQQRVAGISFEAAALTNISQDHLDYHGTMQAYQSAKERLFFEHRPRSVVLNVGDRAGRSLADRLQGQDGFVFTVCTTEKHFASLFARQVRVSRDGISARLHHRSRAADGGDRETPGIRLTSRLLGRHNLENLLVAGGLLMALGHDLTNVCDLLSRCVGVPGRMERCDGAGDDVTVVVDYAHTEDALLRALSTLAELKFSPIICVFGCGGDRDRGKRPHMGQVAAAHADQVFVTSDNPRSERPEQIIEDVLAGTLESGTPVVCEPDRRQAILSSVLDAPPGAAILVAGKGHEDYQLVGDQVLPFDDRHEARAALASRRERRRVTSGRAVPGPSGES